MSNSVIKNSKAQIQELVDSAQSIGVVVGNKQDVDTMGAALGLYLALDTFGKNVQIVSSKEPTVELSTLFGIDHVSKSFEGSTKILTISVPYREGEIDKVSYNIEGDRLKVNLFAETNGITFGEKDIEYIRAGSAPSLLIGVGISDEAEIAAFADLKSAKTIYIDREMAQPAGDVVIVDPSFSSVSEAVAQIAMDLSLGYDPDAYQNMLDGIIAATRNFTAPSTSPYAFEAAGFLMENGAKRKVQAPVVNDRPKYDTFPKEDHFLNQKPQPRVQPTQQQPAPRPQNNQNPRPQFNQGSQNVQNIQSNSTQTQRPMPNSNPAPFNTPQNAPKKQGLSIPDNLSDLNTGVKSAGEGENSMPEDIPDDWFLPKVFKGSRKGN